VVLQRRFKCRSAEYNYVTLQCHLSEEDRRTAPASAFVDATGVDYFENLCLQGNETCKTKKTFAEVDVGVPKDRIAHYVGLHYYVDKELQASSVAGCKKACEMEDEFLCRSFLYQPSIKNGYNCQLYHMDHRTLPDGPATYLNTERPLLDNGSPLGQYMENQCAETRTKPSELAIGETTMDPLSSLNSGTFKPTNVDEADCDHTGTCYDGKA